MALVLASQPVKHPNYPNGDHYAVLDTDTGNVGYFTLAEIQKDIDEEGTQFIGNHHLAKQDSKKVNSLCYIIERINDNAVLVYYENKNRVVIEFNNTHNLSLISYASFLRKQYRDYLEPSIYKLGIVGKRGVSSEYAYKIWACMLDRVLNSTDSRHPTYINTDIYDKWLFYPNFSTWLYSQPNYTPEVLKILSIEKTKFELDKELLSNNKLYKEYSPKNCSLLPKQLNYIISTLGNKDKDIYPVGIFRNSCNTLKVTINLGKLGAVNEYVSFDKINSLENVDFYYNILKQFKGCSNIPKEQWAAVGYCFLWYKERKEAEIKRLAEYWYNYSYNGHIVHVITKECYDALMNWTVDIND